MSTSPGSVPVGSRLAAGWIAAAVLLGAATGCGSPAVMSAADPAGQGSGGGGSSGPILPAGGGGGGGQAGGIVIGALGDGGPSSDAAGAPACGRLVATVRDFRFDHPDFEKDALNLGVVHPGLVMAALGPDQKPVYAPPGPTSTTTGKLNFDQWYRDVPGVNLPFLVTIALSQTGPGVFVYDNQAYFPIDGRGWPGEERFGHNFAFTTEIHTTFTYKGGERFTFTGDDDVFVFVNRKLAVDLGGVHGASSGTIDFDVSAAGLGLARGGTYPLDVFQAERHTMASTFRIATSIECLTVVVE